MVWSPPVRFWLLPNAVLLVVLAVWGAVRYPRLPARIPQHIGSGGVDAWTDRSIGSAFVLVFVYAGVTVLMAGCAELTLRMTPRDELPVSDRVFAPARASLSLLNRPGSRASARRIARALLLFDMCIGVAFLPACAVLWRSSPDPDVPAWLFTAMSLPLLAGTALTVVAAVRDRRL